ncbi:MAG: energy transducer TonB [Gemmatimonadetes bacterium]|nr:energy transducer TonB [Gemmatimonadota bacterium]
MIKARPTRGARGGPGAGRVRAGARGPGRACAGAMRGLMATWLALGCGGDQHIERPTPLFSESPVEYPIELWDQDVEGSTVVRVLVNREGGVDSVAVVESSGHAALDSAALLGARGMEFEPARRAGEPLRVWARVPVHFSKSGEPPTQPPLRRRW